jgi:hypothetical protein
MKLTEEQKKTFKSIILLDAMINNDRQFSTDVNSDDMLLAPLLKELMAQGYVIFTGGHYKVSSSGRDVLVTFNKRYAEYLKIYDIYAFVDLDKGEFAFSSYFDFDSDQAWTILKTKTVLKTCASPWPCLKKWTRPRLYLWPLLTKTVLIPA